MCDVTDAGFNFINIMHKQRLVEDGRSTYLDHDVRALIDVGRHDR